jgi:hypothetical protein
MELEVAVVKRIAAVGAGILLALLFLAPVAFAADPSPSPTGRVLMAVNGDISVPAGDQADVVVVVTGTATINGTANTIVVVDGVANLVGARAESIVAVRSAVTIGPGTVVLGDVKTFDSPVKQIGDAQVLGNITDVGADVAAIGTFLVPALFLLWLGFGLATIAAALLLAGLAARQVRSAEVLISREPGTTFVAGLAGLILTPIVAALVMVTIIGAPLGLGLLLVAWPFVAFVGYLVAAIWIGDFLLRRLAARPAADRPYLAAVIGVIAIAILGVVPLLSAIAALFGFGAVILLAWRTFRGQRSVAVVTPSQSPIPMGA